MMKSNFENVKFGINIDEKYLYNFFYEWKLMKLWNLDYFPSVFSTQMAHKDILTCVHLFCLEQFKPL